MSNPNARVHCLSVLTQFGRLVEGARKHQQMTIDHLSALSGITVRRLMKYETASAPPHWADALRLAQALNIRMSFIIAELRRPLLELSLDEYRSFVAFVSTHGTQQSQELQEDISHGRMIHLEDSSDGPMHDATLEDWPEFLPPLLGNALMVEASRLHTIYRVLHMVANHGAWPVPIEQENIDATVLVDSAALLSRVHHNLQCTCSRLEWLRSRHVVSAPRHFAERLEIQRHRIDQAMRLIAPYWQACEIQLEHDAAPMGEPRQSDSIHFSRLGSRKFSADLSGAIGRAIAASYGVIKMARQRLA